MYSLFTREIIRSALYILVPLAIVGIRMVWRSFKELSSENWPSRQGKCTFAGVEEKNDHFELKVLYSYKLPMEKHPTCSAFHKDFFQQKTANQWAQALHEKEIPVHYNPDKPNNSNLWDSELQSIVEPHSFNTEANKNATHTTFVR